MPESTENTPTEQLTAAEIAESIAEIQSYRDTLANATPEEVQGLGEIPPQLAILDAVIVDLQAQLDIAQIIAELQKYRDRLVNDTLEAVQKAKLPKSKAMAEMEPELAKIDAMMVDLQARQAALVPTVDRSMIP